MCVAAKIFLGKEDVDKAELSLLFISFTHIDFVEIPFFFLFNIFYLISLTRVDLWLPGSHNGSIGNELKKKKTSWTLSVRFVGSKFKVSECSFF